MNRDQHIAWARKIVANIDSIPSRNHRQMAFLEEPDAETGAVFIKVNHKDRKSCFPKTGNIIDTIRESRAYLEFSKKNIPAPGLLFYAIEPFSLNGRGILARQKVDGQTSYEIAKTAETSEAQLNALRKALSALAHIHRAGYSHGDASLYNFLEQNGRLSTIDLSRTKKMTPASQSRDTIRMLSHAFAIEGNHATTEELIRVYKEQNFLPESRETLLKEAERLSFRYSKLSRWTAPEDRTITIRDP
ncbi:MAG: lipopolysaccharide kinase InaA family protein [Verrucomicrobiota bacterium]